MLASQGCHYGTLCTKEYVHKPSHPMNTSLAQDRQIFFRVTTKWWLHSGFLQENSNNYAVK
jgi:hypothetical protein